MTFYKSPQASLIKLALKGAGFTPPQRLFTDLSVQDAFAKPCDSPHCIADLLAHLDFWQIWVLTAIDGKPLPLPETAAKSWPNVEQSNWPALANTFTQNLERCLSYTNDETLLERKLSPDKKLGFGFNDHSVGSALLEAVAMHNAHHCGQVIVLRRMLKAWPPEGGGVTW